MTRPREGEANDLGQIPWFNNDVCAGFKGEEAWFSQSVIGKTRRALDGGRAVRIFGSVRLCAGRVAGWGWFTRWERDRLGDVRIRVGPGHGWDCLG